jgi:hypothetical protein
MWKSAILHRYLLFGLLFILPVISLTGQSTVRQGKPVPSGFCIREPEMELYRMINDYRREASLPEIPLSRSLCYVAMLHAKDIYLNHPDQGPCKVHSWSDKGFWLPFCYPRDETKKATVWDKPRELTSYPSRAYEIVYWENNQLVPDTIMMVWETEEYFNSFLKNFGKWQGMNWNAIGIAIYENYACAWFGDAADPEGQAWICGMQPEKEAVKQSQTDKPASVQSNTPKVDTTSHHPLVPPGPGVAPGWYVIVKTNLKKDTAEKLTTSLKTKGFPDASVLDADGKIRVAVFHSPDKTAAASALKEAKKEFPDAWLLKK